MEVRAQETSHRAFYESIPVGGETEDSAGEDE
ncbi:hypothetical protein RRG08_008859, partial [Elysia crispata]